MPDAMTIAPSGAHTAIALPAPTPAAAPDNAPPPMPAPSLAPHGFILAYNPDAPFANLQDLVAVPDTHSRSGGGAIESANGAPAHPVVYRVAAHLYRALQHGTR